MKKKEDVIITVHGIDVKQADNPFSIDYPFKEGAREGYDLNFLFFVSILAFNILVLIFIIWNVL